MGAGGLVHVNCETHVARSRSQGIIARPCVDSVYVGLVIYMHTTAAAS